MVPERVRELAALAERGDVEMRDAIARERTGKVKLLMGLIEALGGALPTICSKVPAAEEGRASEYGKSVKEWMEGVRAVLVGGSERPNPPLKKIQGTERLEGRALYLSETGSFFSIRFIGTFTNTSTIDHYYWNIAEVLKLTPEQVVEARWPLEHVVEAVADELEAAIAGKAKATEKAGRVAEKIRAASELLRGTR